MRDTIPDQKLQKTVDILDQCSLALKFYVNTGQIRYFREFEWAVKRLHQVVEGGLDD